LVYMNDLYGVPSGGQRRYRVLNLVNRESRAKQS
jgi:hypothetical protein